MTLQDKFHSERTDHIPGSIKRVPTRSKPTQIYPAQSLTILEMNNDSIFINTSIIQIKGDNLNII
jgi:hypothetical protein